MEVYSLFIHRSSAHWTLLSLFPKAAVIQASSRFSSVLSLFSIRLPLAVFSRGIRCPLSVILLEAGVFVLSCCRGQVLKSTAEVNSEEEVWNKEVVLTCKHNKEQQ